MEERAKADTVSNSELNEPLGACEWGQYCFDDTDMSLWHTTCKEEFVLNDGDPKENGMKFCCYCGKSITVQHYFEEDEETGEMIRP